MTTEANASQLLSQRIVLACREHQRTAHALARLLTELVDGGHLRVLGCASLAEYADTTLHIEPRMARDLLRIGRRLTELPLIDAAMASGALPWTKARELVRVATADSEAAWVERAASRSCRALEREVAHVGPAAPPPAEGDMPREPARRRVVLDMEAGDAELVFRGFAVLRARAGLDAAEADDGVLLAAVMRRVIHDAEEEEQAREQASPVEPGREPTQDDPAAAPADPAPSGERYRVVLQHCPDCRDTHVLTHGGHADVSDTITGEAACDAERIDLRPGPNAGRLTRAIPPATRRKVLHRAAWRCEIPNCRSGLWLDVHHVQAWASGGGHALTNLVVLCCAHHRAIHEGILAVERIAAGGIRVTHHDGR